ncbi:unnamed protein product [Polarella glacialis]|uniref:Uncharacterized protein n=1 Tax=Polarella glacialis TaxID=89957 RepID=A0A813JXM9_POLGL|nr:unnamed protein product [Polarella glacialis]
MADAAPSPTDSGAPKPENQAKWLTISDNNMMMARNLTRDMLTVVRNNEIVEAASKDATADAANREKEIAKSKVYAQAKAHEAVISVSFKCIQDIEDAILQTEDSLTKLTHERYKGFATLQVCERRQELREKRPASESFRDVLSDALASEKQILDNMRKDLFDMEEQGKKVIEEMLAKRAVLSHDTGARRLVIAHDISSLKPNLAPAAPGSESPKAHHAAPAAGNAADSADLDATTAHAEKPPQSAEEKKKAQQESKEMIEATMKLLERCAQHRHKTFDLCFKAKQACLESRLAMFRSPLEPLGSLLGSRDSSAARNSGTFQAPRSLAKKHNTALATYAQRASAKSCSSLEESLRYARGSLQVLDQLKVPQAKESQALSELRSFGGRSIFGFAYCHVMEDLRFGMEGGVGHAARGARPDYQAAQGGLRCPVIPKLCFQLVLARPSSEVSYERWRSRIETRQRAATAFPEAPFSKSLQTGERPQAVSVYITGFGPFGSVVDNPSSAICRWLRSRQAELLAGGVKACGLDIVEVSAAAASEKSAEARSCTIAVGRWLYVSAEVSTWVMGVGVGL